VLDLYSTPFWIWREKPGFAATTTYTQADRGTRAFALLTTTSNDHVISERAVQNFSPSCPFSSLL